MLFDVCLHVPRMIHDMENVEIGSEKQSICLNFICEVLFTLESTTHKKVFETPKTFEWKTCTKQTFWIFVFNIESFIQIENVKQ